ncbi:hypothetical protein PsYK624_070850 [Phanerochaete sordida]|uniref:SUZ domain-containing protein n=1 Tax=Phanerochaete sordida TaxID=48140 RepID=A0A9P3G9S6_9APHY|nr:hypothetical protein PsYK624_070850 [Phanerochaete sordida]
MNPEDSAQQSSAAPVPPPAEMSSTQTAPTSPIEYSTVPASASAPEILVATKTLNAASVVFSPSSDFTILQPSRTSSADALLNMASGVAEGSSGTTSPSEPDVQILEALRSKDRLWVLKLGESMETLINEHKQPRIELNPATSYQRMLVHKCAAYHRLTSESDSSRAIYVSLRPDSAVPVRRVAELVPAEESAQPAFKIMRRVPQDRRMRQTSQAGSLAGEDGDVSDSAEPSEAGSSAGRSTTAGSGKRHLTIEEREAAYNEARSRIFMDFEGKDKDKDDSANSSSTNLASGSGYASRSSTGEPEDSSSAATESEWSGPVARDKRDGRRGGSTNSSSRSHRSYNHASGSNSSRHSRAASPSSFPTLYDPQAGSFDPAFGPQGPPHGYIQYYYGYPPTAPGAPPPFMPPYGYGYPPYGYPPQPPSHPHSDPVTPGEPMYPNVQSPGNVPYPPNTYLWPPPHPGQSSAQPPKMTSPAASTQSLPAGFQQQSQLSPASQPVQGAMGYPGYFPQYSPYVAPGYYPPPPTYAVPPVQMSPAPPHMQGQYGPQDGVYRGEFQGNDFGPDSVDHSRAPSRSSSTHGSVNGHGRRSGPHVRRQPWSYGPGPVVGMGPPNAGDFVGPRLTNRRTSSGSAGHRTPGDEASSVTSSSTTSSSSQRTFTSTSSKHPLPARPDWAVGLKPQATLSVRHGESHSRTMSPARMGGNLPHHSRPHQPPPSLQATDFPPLSTGPVPEKRAPVASGAWTNASTVRTALRAGPPSTTSAPVGTALVHYPNGNGGPRGPSPNAGRADEQVRAYAPGRNNAELFGPNGAPAHAANGEDCGMEPSPDALAERIEVLSLSASGDMPLTASPTPATPPGEAQ